MTAAILVGESGLPRFARNDAGVVSFNSLDSAILHINCLQPSAFCIPLARRQLVSKILQSTS